MGRVHHWFVKCTTYIQFETNKSQGGQACDTIWTYIKRYVYILYIVIGQKFKKITLKMFEARDRKRDKILLKRK